jgi:hypothetical protein
MKLNLKLIPVLLIGIVFTYTACKKSGSTVKTLSAKAVTSQVVLNLTQTLYSGFGAFNISNGLNAPSTLGVNRQKLGLRLSKGRQLNSLGGDITCGLSMDTILNYTTTLDDGSQASITGPIKFTFLCTNGIPSGFNVFDNLNITESTSQLAGTFKLGENLTLQSVNPQDSSSNLTFGGTIDLSSNIKYKTGSKQTTSESYDYNFTSVIINSIGSIDSGSATFTTKGSNTSGVWDYQGTIVFLGNNKVKITINGTVYNVDLQTGQVI